MDLVHFNKAKAELALASNIDEIKAIHDKAVAFLAYKKQQGASLEIQNLGAELKIWAEHRMGEMIPEIAPQGGDRKSGKSKSTRSTLIGYGISKKQSQNFQIIASLPVNEIEMFIAEAKDNGKEFSSSDLIRLANKKTNDEEVDKLKTDIPMIEGKFKTLVLDPPWPMVKIEREVRPNQNGFDYPVMDEDELMAIPVNVLMDTEAHVYLWTTQKFLPMALKMVELWELNYIFVMVWHKSGGFQPVGLPQYNCEFVVFGKKGNMPFLDTKAFPTCFTAERREHSRKPDEFYELVKRVSPGPLLEMYARESREGWTQWGNEATKFDEK